MAASLEQSQAELTPADNKALTDARAELRRAFEDEHVHAIAGADPAKRFAFREAIMHQTIQRLPSRACKFALATDAADRLITPR